MRKGYFGLLLVILLLVFTFLTGCADTSEPADSTQEDDVSDDVTVEEMTIKIAHILAPDHSWNEGAKKFAEVVERESNGVIKVEIFPSAQLGDEIELMESMQLGTIEMGIISTAKSVNLCPPVGLADMPFLFRDWNHVHSVLDGEVGQALNQSMLDMTGLRALGWFDQGFRHVITANKPVQTMADFNGLKIRTPDSLTYTKTFEYLGASPTPIAFSELFSALETGVVSGFEGSYETIYTSSLYEVTDYISLTNHIWSGAQLLINNTFYENLSPALRAAVDTAAVESIEYVRSIVIARDDENKQKLIDEGMIIDDTLINNEADLLSEAVSEFVTEYAQSAGVADLLAKIR